MDNKKYVLNSISYVTVVNIFSMVVTAFLTLIVPRYIDLFNYGLWQLFVFYQGYLGFFHFGWNDGIYLRCGGIKYSNLDKERFFSQFWLQIIFECLMGFLIVLLFQGSDNTKGYIVWQLAINMVILNSRYMLIYILQATARIKEYAIVLFADRFIYFTIIAIVIFTNKANYKTLICAETYSKLLAYILAIFYCKNIVLNGISKFKIEIKEIITNVNVGIKIMFSNIASIMIVGISRYGIQQNWGIETFGEISLTITLSQLFITFVTNIGMVIFPLLKKMDKENLVKMYQNLKEKLTIFLVVVFVFFYPGKTLLLKWLPAYENSIKFMSVLLPLCFFESKMALLNNTYLKALRKEKEIMFINLGTMLIGIFLSFITSYILKNLLLSVFSITLLIALRCFWSEKVVNNELNIKSRKLINLDNLMMILFILFNYFIDSWYGFSFYLIACLFFVIEKIYIRIKKNKRRIC